MIYLLTKNVGSMFFLQRICNWLFDLTKCLSFFHSPWSYHNGGSWPTLLWQVILCFNLHSSEEIFLETCSQFSFTCAINSASCFFHYESKWHSCFKIQFTLACIKMGRGELAQKAVAVAEKRLSNDRWPEYYDTRTGRFIGKQSRLYQTWSIAGFLASKMLLENPAAAAVLTCDEDLELLEACACGLSKNARIKCSRLAAKSQIVS